MDIAHFFLRTNIYNLLLLYICQFFMTTTFWTLCPCAAVCQRSREVASARTDGEDDLTDGEDP